MTKAERSKILCSRVEDWLRVRDVRQTPETRLDTQRLFVRRSLAIAEARGMRVWKDTAISSLESGVKSLRYLLGDYKQIQKGLLRWGQNDNWVLDIWEVSLDQSHSPLTSREEDTLEDDFTLADQPVHEDIGVVVERPSTSKKVPRSLGMRLIEAYLNSDENEIMVIAMELDR